MCGWLTLLALPAAGQYNFVGNSSSVGDDCYVITPAAEWQNGAIWYNDAIDLNEPFHLQYQAYLGDDPEGADGMVFVMQQVGNNVLGADGEGMGFSGFSPSFGVEFDTYQNDNLNDPPFDHIAFLRNGNVNHNSPDNIAGPVQALPDSPIISDDQDHIVDIFWEPSSSNFAVWIDCEPRLEATIDLVNAVFQGNSTVFWGFTGATGGFFNLQQVCLDPSILGLPESYGICLGDEILLEATGASGGTYSWTPTDFLSDPSISAPVANPPVTTTYTVSFTDLCGTVQEQTTTVEVFDPQVDLGGDVEACEGSVVTLTPVESNGTLTWSDGSEGPSLEVTESGVYEVTATDGICTATDEVSVTFTENPELNLPAEVDLCEGDVYTADLSGTGLTIVWDDDPTAGAVRDFAEAGTYTVTGSLGACEATADIEINVNPLPSFDLGPDVEVCDGLPVTLSAEAPGATVTWNTGHAGTTIAPVESGFYEATAVAGDCSFTDGITVLFLPVPNPTIQGATAICLGETATLTASGGDQFIWSTGDTGPATETGQPGSVSVTATDASSGCTAQASVSVAVTSPPSIVLPSEVEKCEGRQVVLTAQVQGAITTSWDHGASGRTATVTEPGLYTITAANPCGEASATIAVVDEECFQNLFIPNAFTPNGDGLNDLFRVTAEGVVRFRMQILDRWGTLVFETDHIDGFWNGSYQNGGYYCPTGVYAVHLEVEFDDQRLLEDVRHVTLLR